MRTLSALAFFSTVIVSGSLLASCTSSLEDSVSATGSQKICGEAAASQDLTELTLINSAGVATSPYVDWGVREGCFEKHGLDVVSLPGRADNVEKVGALIGGGADIVADTPLETIVAIANSGFPAKFVAGGYEFDRAQLEQAKTPELVDGRLVLQTALLAGPGVDYEDISSLVGKRVGVNPGGGGANGLAIERLVRSAGIELQEVEFVEIDSPDRLSALIRGDLDFASLTGATAYQALEAGGRIVLYPGAFLYDSGAVVIWYTSDEITQSRPEDIVAFQRALREVHGLLMDPVNFDNFLQFLEEDFGLEPAVIERFSLPTLVTRQLTKAEFEYWVPILEEEEMILEGFVLPSDLIFEGN